MKKTEIINEMVRLQILQNRRHRGFLNTAKSTKAIKKMVSKFYHEASESGVVESYWHRGKLQAIFLIFEEKNSSLGKTEHKIYSVENPRSKKSWNWIKSNLKKYSHSYGKDSTYWLHGQDKARLLFFEKTGFNIEALIQMGVPSVGLRKLERSYKPKGSFEEFGLTCGSIKTKGEVDEVMKIYKTYFTKNPQFCSFATNPDYLKSFKKELVEAKKSGDSHVYIIKDKKRKVLGMFSMSLGVDPFFGKRAGMEFIFSKALIGKGYSKVAYKILFKKMIEEDVRYYFGGTSQPAVIKLGKLMERWPLGFLLSYGKGYFPRSHFF